MTSYVQDNQTPVIGINSNPSSSLGYLCLPDVCSLNIQKTFDILEKQKYSFIDRRRIRVSMKSTESMNIIFYYYISIQNITIVLFIFRKNGTTGKYVSRLCKN